MTDELLVNVIATNVPPSRCINVTCADCGTVNHVVAWQVFPLPGTDDGATAVTCWSCDARQHDIRCSAIPADQLARIAYTFTPDPITPVIAFNSSMRLHASR